MHLRPDYIHNLLLQFTHLVDKKSLFLLALQTLQTIVDGDLEGGREGGKEGGECGGLSTSKHS